LRFIIYPIIIHRITISYKYILLTGIRFSYRVKKNGYISKYFINAIDDSEEIAMQNKYIKQYEKSCHPNNFVIGIIFLFFVFLFSPCLFAEYDKSYRIDQNIYCTIDERFQLAFYSFEQINKNRSDYDYFEYGTGLQYQTPITWLSFLVYYQQSYSKGTDEKWSIEKKPSINMNASFMFSHFKLSNQIRYEYRITPEWHNYRIKNNLEISLHNIVLHPYTGWEIYYEDHDKKFMLNRFRFGIVENVYNNIYMGTYYRIDYSKINSRWELSRQLIGIQVTLKY
jgi:hypothetical protein